MERRTKMKRISIILAVLLVMLVTTGAAASLGGSDHFLATLSGGDEVPARDTNARGVATFDLNADATELGYTLIAANIENVVASHIHCGADGVSGPVGVTLYLGTAGSGRFSGVLASGTITAPDAGNACGWLTLADVVAAMESGNTYVNVHTNDGVAPTNTGPGDFPGGEIRGQIR
jgi:hypothetical protein